MTSPHAPYGADPRAVYPTPESALIVSTTGDDATGAGTLAAPYRTIKHAVSQVAAGGTVAIRGGEYHEGATYPQDLVADSILVPAVTPGVTIQNYEGEEVWLDGSVPVTDWSPYDGAWRAPLAATLHRSPSNVRGQDVSGYGTYLLAEYPIAHWPEMVLVDGVQQRQVQTIGEVGPGTFFVQGSYLTPTGVDKHAFTSTHYVLGDNPSGRDVRIGVKARALTNAGDDTAVRGIGFRRYVPNLTDLGVVFANVRARFTMENVTIEDSSNCGIDVGSVGWSIRHCTIQRCGRIGINAANRADGGLLEWSYFELVNNRVFNYGPSGGNIKIGMAWDTTVRYNRMHDTRGHSVWYDECCYRGKVYGNWMTDTWGIGILYEISARALIVDNIMAENGVRSDSARRPPSDNPAIDIKSSTNCHIWNNTIVVPEVGVRFTEGYRKPLNEDGVSWRTTHPMGSVFGQDKNRGDAFYQAEGFADTWDFYRTEMTWDDTGAVLKNNVLAGAAGISSVQSVFLRFFSETAEKGMAELTGPLPGPNVFARLDGATPQRFANGCKVAAVVSSAAIAYFNMTGLGHEGSPSYRDTMGDSTSVLVSAPVALGREGVLARSMLAAYPTAPIPAEVQALRTGSPFRLGTHGAGDPGPPPPEVRDVLAIWYGSKAILTA